MQKEEWHAIVHCDSSYDGQFFYAVKTTGIFCRPSCRSRAPKPDHVVLFATVDAAIDSGFRACKRCQPEKLHYPVEEMVHRAMRYMDGHYNEPLTLGVLAKELHLNPYRLHHIFRRITGVTPADYILTKRITEAKRLLMNTNLSVTDIAMSVGIVSASHFSTVFHKRTGHSPTVFRQQNPLPK